MTTADAPHTLVIEGWRFLPHSYAIVNQFQCLELLRRPGEIRLFFRDVPYFRSDWRPIEGLFDKASEDALRGIPAPPAGLLPDAELRIAFPYDFLGPSQGKRTFVFGTAEFMTVPPAYICGGMPISEAQRRTGFTIITPSNWSKQGFVQSGVRPEKVAVIPHGVDTEIYAPPKSSEERETIRQQLGIKPDDYVFFHVGAMTGNKGLRLLLAAFSQVLPQRPNVRLVLKGMDALYLSRQMLENELRESIPTAPASTLARISYLGQPLTFAEMARLYQAADCYVSPYLAEGFNLPVLEAAACGLPVICTAGGATDDFVTDDFALRINSRLHPVQIEDQPQAMALEPDMHRLTEVMVRIIDDTTFATGARQAAPQCIAGQFTWRHIVDRLLKVLFAF